MELQQFVAETLKQIINGVRLAQEHASGVGAVVNPKPDEPEPKKKKASRKGAKTRRIRKEFSLRCLCGSAALREIFCFFCKDFTFKKLKTFDTTIKRTLDSINQKRSKYHKSSSSTL